MSGESVKDPIPVLQEAGWALGAGLDAREISPPPIGIQPLDHLESLCRLRYPGSHKGEYIIIYFAVDPSLFYIIYTICDLLLQNLTTLLVSYVFKCVR